MTGISLAMKLAQSLQVSKDSNRQVINMGSWFGWSVHLKAVGFCPCPQNNFPN